MSDNSFGGSFVTYVLLGAIGLLLAGQVILGRRDAVALVVFWVAGSAVFTANYLVMDLMELYHYRTGLLPGLIPDTVLGVFLAELGFVAGWAVWVVYRFPLWAGTAVGSTLVVVLEFLFRQWGIFEGHGWRLWHTAVTFPPYFLLIYWFRAVAERNGVTDGWVRTGIRISIALWWSHFLGMIVYWMMAGLVFRVNLMPTFARNQTLGAILTIGLAINVAMVWVMASRGEKRTFRLLGSAVGLLLLGQLWMAMGLWQFRAPWNIYLHTAAQVATIYIAALCDDMVGRWAGVPGSTTGAPVEKH